MAITSIASVSVASAGANGPDTTGAITTTGATMIEMTVSFAVGATVYPTVSDSKGNSYTIRNHVAGVGAAIRKWYVLDPTVGSGHTFTVDHTGGYAVLMVRAYAGDSIQPDTLAVPSGAHGTTHPSAAGLPAGQLTPSADGALITTGLCHANLGVSGLAISGSTGGGTLTIIAHTNYSAGQNVGGGYADMVQTTATQISPFWSWVENGRQVALCMASYIEGEPIPLESHRNLLTGFTHTVAGGSDNLLVGRLATVEESELVALFSLDDSPHTEDRSRTFCVHADNICLNGEVTINGEVFEAPGSPGTISLDDLADVVITAPSTDDVLVYNGSEWVNEPVPSGGSPGGTFAFFPTFTPPVDGDFTWVNQGSASITSSGGGGLYLRGPAGGSVNFRIRIKAAPSTPYTITTAMLPHILKNSNTHAGMVFRQASDGKLHTWGLAASTVTYDLASQKWTNATTFSANYAVRPMGAFGALLWLRVVDDGANRVCSYSFDGWNWTQIHSIGRTDFLTATEVGFYIGDTSNLSEPGLLLLSWEET